MSLRSDLLCVNGCGFYGNPEWQWYCSKCWREHQRKAGSPARSARAVKSPVKSPIAPIPKDDRQKSSPKRHFLSSPTKEDDGKQSKRQTLDRNFKQMFGARMGTKESPEKKLRPKPQPSPYSRERPELPPEARVVSSEYAAFLNRRLERPGVADISKQVKGMVDKLLRTTAAMTGGATQDQIDDLSAMVQEFYLLFLRRLETKPIFQALTEEDRIKIVGYAEKYVMICCYKQLFCPTMTTDEEKDLELQNRIRSLNWISTNHLHCSINESSQDVRDLLYQAINDILEMDGKMAPQDKMESLVKCSKNIFEMLKLSNETPASADDFLPCLIYMCLKANPPRIQSNINFITRFCNENKLRMGEGGYFFANLCCAMSFIENMTAESVNMDEDEFESYITGTAVPPGSWRSSLLMCEGLQVMSQNLKTLSDLRIRHDRVLTDARCLQEEMTTFQSDIEQEVQSVLSRTEYTIIGPKKPVDPDEDVDDTVIKGLPPPLLPEASSSLPKVAFDLTDSSNKTEDEDEMGQNSSVALEDYLSLSSAYSDNVSLMSLDLSGHNNSSSAVLDDLPSFGGGGGDKEAASSKNNNLLDLTPVEEENAAAKDPPPHSAYRGFSAQSCTIPSISCDNAVPEQHQSKTSSVSSPPTESSLTISQTSSSFTADSSTSSATEFGSVNTTVKTKSAVGHPTSSSSDNPTPSSTSSSSPLISAAESISSPDDNPQHVPAEEEDANNATGRAEETAVRVLSGIFETFDNLL